MKKKTILCGFAVSMFWYAGCTHTGPLITNYNIVELTTEELKKKSEQRDISVLTKDNETFEFLAGKYKILNDTLSGTTRLEPVPPSKETHIVRVMLPLSDIVSIETKEISPVKTIVMMGAIGLTVGAFIYYVAEVFKPKELWQQRN